jgi:uncharacterized membrane protein YdbT with pleckstrin-like domain
MRAESGEKKSPIRGYGNLSHPAPETLPHDSHSDAASWWLDHRLWLVIITIVLIGVASWGVLSVRL